jgi:hypothetical protein
MFPSSWNFQASEARMQVYLSRRSAAKVSDLILTLILSVLIYAIEDVKNFENSFAAGARWQHLQQNVQGANNQ